VIVANRGYCFGVGFELSLACDFRIASETTQYALPEAEEELGQNPGIRRFGAVAEDVGINPHQGYRDAFQAHLGEAGAGVGHRTECVPDAELEKATDRLVDELRTFSPLAQANGQEAS